MAKSCCTFLALIWSFLIFYAYWLAIILGYSYYAWSHHVEEKHWTCYAINSDKSVTVALSNNDSGDLHDVSANFQVVCVWGAITYMLIVVLFTVMVCLGERALDDCGGCYFFLVFLAFLNYLAHFLTLMIMRWRHAGKICSGDYLDSDETGFSRWSLIGTKEPYIHETGSFLFYAIQS